MASRESFSLADGLLAALVLFFTLAFFHAHGASDVDRFWLNWINILAEHEHFSDGFAAVWADYPPVSILMLDMIGKIAAHQGVEAFVILKAFVLFFLFATTLAYYIVSGQKSVALLMHLMLLPSSILLTYLDIWYAPFLILCFWYLRKARPGFALFYFALSCSIKYQPAILAPFIAIYVWKLYQLQGQQAGFKAAKAIGITLLLYIALMFWMVGNALWVSWFNALFHNRLSFQGLNAYWAYMQIHVMLGVDVREVRNASDALLHGSRLLFLLAYAWLLFRFAREKINFTAFLFYAMAGYYAYFSLSTGVHENHLFVAAIVASWLFVCDARTRPVALFVMLMNNFNLVLFNGLTGEGLQHSLAFGIDMTIPIALVNALFFAFLLIALSLPSTYRDRWLGVTN
jgi:Gpi18-like mannosyltransferase